MHHKLLIANRGEIACRIIRTAKRLGIQTVAVYSEADRTSLHVRNADEAWFIGPALAKESYLNIEKIIDIAKKSGATCIHPGYGFLSENPDFAKACIEKNIIFVGPSIHAMEIMASKQLAKKTLEHTDVPLIPGYHGTIQTCAHLRQKAEEIGFPILLKAAMGGGGKGMRAVYHLNAFDAAFEATKREALAYFNDDTLLIEKLIEQPRHVEVQIIADSHGQVLHLFDRDCSIQRRHQKVIEEAPAPNLPSVLREKIAKSAITISQTIGYLGAGTIEYLVDPLQNAFYFMEMNTRLQVEHPVTEMITDMDLVEWQLRVAFGERLPFSQEQIKSQGHAIECRLYAEDPAQHFIPSVGQVLYLLEPQQVNGIRIDSAIEENDVINPYYDAMFAKLIVWDETREKAIAKLQRALNDYHIAGVKTNIEFLKNIVHHHDFLSENLSTHFLNDHHFTINTTPLPTLYFAAAFDYIQHQPQDRLLQDTWGWPQLTPRHWSQSYILEQKTYHIQFTALSLHQVILQINQETPVTIQLEKTASHEVLLHTVEQSWSAKIIPLPKNKLCVITKTHTYTLESALTSYQTDLAHQHNLCAPMTSTVIRILKALDSSVTEGEPLLILEAMKMEHTIIAPFSGTIKSIFYQTGAQVQEGAQLIEITPLETKAQHDAT